MGNRNVFLIVMDTARKKSLSCYDYKRDTTPFLSEFANESVVFENAVSQAPWTLPSHASMFTGKYPSEHGAVQENPYLDSEDTIAQLLSENDYSTAVFSANAWISPHTGLTSGFEVEKNFIGNLPKPIREKTSDMWKKANESDQLRPIAKRTADFISWFHKKVTGKNYKSYTPDIMSEAKYFVQNTDGDKFVCLNLLDPHLPYKPPLEYLELFGDYEEIPDVCQDSKEYNAGIRDIDDDEWDKIRDLYDAEIRYMDNYIKNFVRLLRDCKEFEDSLIIVCSDHGELHGKYGIYGHEFGLYEELVNVPLLIRHPERDSSTVDETVETMDLYHTIADFATDSGDFESSRSIFNSQYRDESQFENPELAYSEYSKPMIALHQLRKLANKRGRSIPSDSIYASRLHSVRSNEWKYIRRSNVEDEFFSLSGEYEVENYILRNKKQGIIDEYRNILENHPIVGNTARDEQLGTEAVDDSIKDRLSDLGYMD